MIRRNLRSKNSNKRLYESIMRDITKVVKRHLNESIVEQDNFYDYSMEFYNDWINHISRDVIEKLISNGSITDGMDFDDAWRQVQEKFDEGLDNAVNGDWWTVGNSLGFSDSELENIYNDDMQAKTDIFAEYLDEDGEYIQLEEDDDDDDDDSYSNMYADNMNKNIDENVYNLLINKNIKISSKNKQLASTTINTIANLMNQISPLDVNNYFNSGNFEFMYIDKLENAKVDLFEEYKDLFGDEFPNTTNVNLNKLINFMAKIYELADQNLIKAPRIGFQICVDEYDDENLKHRKFIHKFFKKYKKYCDDWFDDDENFYHFNPVVKTPEENSKILIKLFKDALQQIKNIK